MREGKWSAGGQGRKGLGIVCGKDRGAVRFHERRERSSLNEFKGDRGEEVAG